MTPWERVLEIADDVAAESARLLGSVRPRTLGGMAKVKDRRNVDVADLIQEALIAAHRTFLSWDGPTHPLIARWAVLSALRRLARHGKPISVAPTDSAERSDFTAERKRALSRPQAWKDVNEIEQEIAGQDEDPADVAERRELIRLLAARAEPRDFLLVVRSAVREVKGTADAEAQGVTPQAVSAARIGAARRVAESLRRAA